MPSQLRRIDSSNLEDLVHVINGSSSGYVFQFDTDVYSFLALSRFWNLSYEHSILSYVDNQPAGVLLNAVNPSEHQAFSLYWGVLPQFRKQRVAMSLVDAYFSLLRRQGYKRTDADETHGSPSPIYKKLGYRPNQVFAELETSRPWLRNVRQELEIREVEIDSFVPLVPIFPDFRYWAQRPGFLRTSARSIEILGAFRDQDLHAYLVRTFSPGHLVIMDFRFKTEAAGWALLSKAIDRDVPPPYRASFVPVDSPAFALLSEAGFNGTKRFTSMTLDFSETRSPFVLATSR